VSKLGETTCTQCAADTQCGGDNFDQDACDTTKLTSRAGEKSCYPYQFTYPVTPGYNSGDGLYTPVESIGDDTIAIEVHPGEYNFIGGLKDPNGSGVDLDCPVGYQCLWPWMQDWRKCPAGTYSGQSDTDSDYNTWACEQCPEQWHCPLRHDVKEEVDTGYFSPFGVHLPLPVRAGWAAGPSQPIIPCTAGEHSDDFAGTCSSCIKGELCNFPSNRPLPCNEGMESLTTDQFTCVPCLQNEVFNSAT
jgi:hypothetical protein